MGARCLIVLLGFLPLVAATQVTSTRVTEYDWRCESADGSRISDHQRFDTAFVSCLNAPTGAYVQGGRYRIGKPAVSVPEPEPAPAGTATLSWTPPTQNTDGTPLTDLAGYRIHYGPSSDMLLQTVQLANPGVSRYVIEGLAPGVYYFAVRAYTASSESYLSNVATRTVR